MPESDMTIRLYLVTLVQKMKMLDLMLTLVEFRIEQDFSQPPHSACPGLGGRYFLEHLGIGSEFFDCRRRILEVAWKMLGDR